MTLGLGLHADNLFPEAAGHDWQADAIPRKPARHPRSLHDHFGFFAPQRFGRAPSRSEPVVGRSDGQRRASANDDLDRPTARQAPGPPDAFPFAGAELVGQQQPVVYRERFDDSGRKLSLAAIQLGCSSTTRRPNRRSRPIAPGRDKASWTSSPMMPSRSRANLGTGDRDRLDAYFTSVRDLEKRMVETEHGPTARSRKSKLPSRSISATRTTSSAANG